MILITSGEPYLKEIAGLLAEWTGRNKYPHNYVRDSLFIVARDTDRDKLVGVVELIIIDDPYWIRKWGLVENVYVSENYRRNGIAKDIMHQIEILAMGVGCAFLKLTTRKEEGKALYRSLGYEEGSSFYRDLWYLKEPYCKGVKHETSNYR